MTHDPATLLSNDPPRAAFGAGDEGAPRAARALTAGLERALIVSRVGASPGIHTRELASTMGVDEKALEYHLRRLRRDGVLVREPLGRMSTWFVAGGGYCPVLRKAIPLLRRDDVRSVALALSGTPTTAVAVARATGLTEGRVRWTLWLLEDAGLVEPGSRFPLLSPGAEVCRERAVAQERCDQWGKCALSRRLTSCPSLSATGAGPGRSSGPPRAPSSE